MFSADGIPIMVRRALALLNPSFFTKSYRSLFQIGLIRFEWLCIFFAAVGNQLFQVDPPNLAWTDLSSGSVLGIPPSPRYAVGATSDSEKVFIFGGFSNWVTDANGSGACNSRTLRLDALL